MEGHGFECSKFWILRIDTGEDILISLKKFIKENNIKQGVVVMGYGTLGKISLHWVTHNRFPPEADYGKWEGGIEIMSINGMIVNGEPHVHITASDKNGAFGGHLEEGCECYVLCEIGIVEVSGASMTREIVTITDENGNTVKRPQLKFVDK
jgi:predicted DNA-binding protein with PD1-like motif